VGTIYHNLQIRALNDGLLKNYSLREDLKDKYIARFYDKYSSEDFYSDWKSFCSKDEADKFIESFKKIDFADKTMIVIKDKQICFEYSNPDS
jgi:hypothetical protein